MAQLELKDFDTLVRDLANLQGPLLTQQWSYHKWFIKFSFEVTLNELDSVQAAGPIVIESELTPGSSRLLIEAQIPELYVKSSCTVSGGRILIRDGDYPWEVWFYGRLTGDILLTEPSAVESQVIHLYLTSFQFKSPIFPSWFQRLLRRSIEKTLERSLSELICNALPLRRRGEQVSAETALDPSGKVSAGETIGSAPRYGRIAKLAYGTSFCLSYALVFPVLMLASAVPQESSAAKGLRDGALAASQAVSGRQRRPSTRPQRLASIAATQA